MHNKNNEFSNNIEEAKAWHESRRRGALLGIIIMVVVLILVWVGKVYAYEVSDPQQWQEQQNNDHADMLKQVWSK